jgi:hypothetical protein
LWWPQGKEILLASQKKQFELFRAPKYWPSQTVDTLLPLIALAVEDPHSAGVAALIRTSLESRTPTLWAGVVEERRRPEAFRSSEEVEELGDLNEDLGIKRA